ncbi:transporter associated domain-containing protein [Providencia zhijiangensis]|uniref:Transporter associated domain-containing protein n=1 Tax=Providencia zhijiangensis TaxID=3053982 RepID=A0ABZ0MY15_9GAMM|nr:transporter associated domain-containing protein [Providencia sp. D4759]WPA91014.1 transporter associated domain-containing protein [Providencia sp. D4759]
MIEVDSDKTLNQFIHVNTENEPSQGDVIKLDNIQIKIDEMIGPRIVTVILEPVKIQQE